jgi:hypothetical protein
MTKQMLAVIDGTPTASAINKVVAIPVTDLHASPEVWAVILTKYPFYPKVCDGCHGQVYAEASFSWQDESQHLSCSKQ